MNPSAFGRIVWKECRAQCSLWVALLLGAVLLQAAYINMRVGLVTPTQPWWAPGLQLTACFMVASVALLFAGETEDGTGDWLLQLPVRPGVVIAAKLCFTVVAGVGNHRISVAVAPRPTASPDGLMVPRGAYYATGNDLRPPHGGFRFEEARPDRIEFINVGVQPRW